MGKGIQEWTKKICGSQPLKNLKWYGLLRQIISFQFFQRLSCKKFTWSIIAFLDPYIGQCLNLIDNLWCYSILRRKSKNFIWPILLKTGKSFCSFVFYSKRVTDTFCLCKTFHWLAKSCFPRLTCLKFYHAWNELVMRIFFFAKLKSW